MRVTSADTAALRVRIAPSPSATRDLGPPGSDPTAPAQPRNARRYASTGSCVSAPRGKSSAKDTAPKSQRGRGNNYKRMVLSCPSKCALGERLEGHEFAD